MAADPVAAQRRLLAQWLRERELDLRLPLADEVALAPAVPAAPPALRPRAGPPVRAGDIRLLPPLPGTVTAVRLLYVAVLEPRGADRWLTAPFGRYSVPGLPGEWRTGLRAMALRVLCVWNAREVSDAALGTAWRADRLSVSALRKALELRRRLQAGEPLRTTGGGDLGPPVRHPRDPRLLYEVEEAADYDDALRAAEHAAGAAALLDADAGEWLMAAQPPPPLI
jgi:hypothetical protein